MGETTLFGLRNLTNKNEDRVYNSLFVVEPSLFSQNVAEEIHPTFQTNEFSILGASQ